MDFADDVAYSVHDVEDGIVAHHIDLDRGRRGPGAVLGDRPAAVLAGGNRCGVGRGLAAADRRCTYWPSGSFDDSRRALGGLKDLTSQLIGRFCDRGRAGDARGVRAVAG